MLFEIRDYMKQDESKYRLHFENDEVFEGLTKIHEMTSGDIDIMVRLFNTENIGDGRDLYNVCYFCGYETMHVPIFDNIDEADDDIIKHIYNKHYEMTSVDNTYRIFTGEKNGIPSGVIFKLGMPSVDNVRV